MGGGAGCIGNEYVYFRQDVALGPRMLSWQGKTKVKSNPLNL